MPFLTDWPFTSAIISPQSFALSVSQSASVNKTKELNLVEIYVTKHQNVFSLFQLKISPLDLHCYHL